MKLVGTAEVRRAGQRWLIHAYSKAPSGWRVASGPFASLDVGAPDEELGAAVRNVLLAGPYPVEEPTLENADARMQALADGLGTSKSALRRAKGVAVDTDGDQARIAVSARAGAPYEGVLYTGQYVWAPLDDPIQLGRALRSAIDRSR